MGKGEFGAVQFLDHCASGEDGDEDDDEYGCYVSEVLHRCCKNIKNGRDASRRVST